MKLKMVLFLIISLLVAVEPAEAKVSADGDVKQDQAPPAIPPPAEIAPSADSEQIKKQSKIPSTQRDFLNMIKKSMAILEKNPKDSGAYLDLAYANRNLDCPAKALAFCNKSIELNSDIAVAYGERALNYLDLHQPQKALVDLDRAIALDGNNSAFYSHRGWVYTSQKLYAKTIEECSQSIKIYAGYSPAFYLRGRAYLAMSEYEKAIADFTAAIKLFPNQVCDYYTSRAFAYLKRQDYASALTDLAVSMRLEPNDRLATIYKGIALSRSGANDSAINNLTKTIQSEPQNASALKNRAVLYRVMRNFDKSMADLEAAVKIAPQDATIYSERGLTLVAMNDPIRAISEFDKAIALDPDEKTFVTQKTMARARSEPLMADKDGIHYFVDATSGDVTNPKPDWKSIILSLRQAKIAENLPPAENFKLFMQRDLDKYFNAYSGKSINSEFELLRSMPTLGPAGQPLFFCWAKVFQGKDLICEGAVRLEAENKAGFKVTDFLKVSAITSNPDQVMKVFPATVSLDIFLRANLKPENWPVKIDRAKISHARTREVES